MKRLLIISTLIVLTSCDQSTKTDDSRRAEKQTAKTTEIVTSQPALKTEKKENYENLECANFQFSSAEQQADSLLVFYKNATDSSLTNRIKWEQKFFCAFPKSFEEMQSLFGFDDENGAGPLYSNKNNTYSYTDRHIMSDVIGFFSELRSIPDSAYYEKYVRINIDGYWEADNISEAFGLHHRLTNDTKAVSKALSVFTDEEIRSVFRFIFDGPHPKNEYNKEIFETLKPKIKEQNERLGNLLYEAYSAMMAEDDGHGH